MLQAALSDCLSFDPFPFSENGFVAPEVDVCRCDVVQALVVTLIVVIFDECSDLTLKVAGQIVVFEQNPVLHGLMPAFDLALGLRMEWCTADMLHLVIFQPFGQIARDVTGSVVTEQTWHVAHDGMVAS